MGVSFSSIVLDYAFELVEPCYVIIPNVSKLVLASLIAFSLFGCQRAPLKTATMVHTTPVYDVDAIFRSMEGPEYTNLDLLLTESVPELLWLTGYEAVMVGPDGQEPRDQQFMCHNTLGVHRGLDEHRKLFRAPPYGTRRLFTLSQGQTTVDLPEGFGIPVVSSEKLQLQSQVLNLNAEAIGQKVAHKVSAHFVRDQDVHQPITPLCIFPSAVNVPTVDPNALEMPFDPDELGCAVNAGGPTIHVSEGLMNTSHWVVKPGKETRRSEVSNIFPWDTTVHYMAIHVHPFAETYEFWDKTTGKLLHSFDCSQLEKGVGLKEVGFYSSAEGIPVFADHDYELTVTYNNTSGEDQTAMAFIFFYVEDKLFHKPGEKELAGSDESFCQVITDPVMAR